MRNHPKKDQQLTIKNGPLKGRQIIVVDYLTTQYQGKDIRRIKAPHLTTAMVNRGKPLDDDTVFVRFLPSLGCVHDSELKLEVVKQADGKETITPEEPPSNVKSIKSKRKKNASPQTTP
jgi:hypothetical protein